MTPKMTLALAALTLAGAAAPSQAAMTLDGLKPGAAAVEQAAYYHHGRHRCGYGWRGCGYGYRGRVAQGGGPGWLGQRGYAWDSWYGGARPY